MDRGAFFTPQTAAPPICGRSAGTGAFCYLLILPSRCPTLATGTTPPSPPRPRAGSGLVAPQLAFSLSTLGGDDMAAQPALTRVLLLLLRHLHMALQESSSRRLHLRCRCLQCPPTGLGATQRGVGVLDRPIEQEAPLLQLPCGAGTASPILLPVPLLPGEPSFEGKAGRGWTGPSGLHRCHSNAEANNEHPETFRSS